MGRWILGRTSGIPRRFFAGANEITKREREPGIEIGLGLLEPGDIERTL